MSDISALVKRMWVFDHGWLETSGKFYVMAWHRMWGVRKSFYSEWWDVAHEQAREWAESEEAIVNGVYEQRDTEPAPAAETK